MILPLLTPRGISLGSVTASVDASIKSTIPSPEFVFTLAEKPTLVICGTLREVAQHLPTLRTMIHALVEDSFQLLRIVAFENDSSDETLSLLQDWNRDWPMTILSEQNLSLPERTQRLAHGRNKLWRAIQRLSPSPNVVLMMDFDDVNHHLSNMQTCLQLPSNWIGCCANQYQVYYDLWALRKEDWLDCDYKYTCRLRPGERKPFRHIPAGVDPIPVDSCFGGAALYHYDKMKNLPNPFTDGYNGFLDHHPTCEHVAFHKAMKEHDPNSQLYIQPKFLNDGPNDKRATGFGGVKLRLEREWRASMDDPSMKVYYERWNSSN